MSFLVSILIPTYNRSQLLGATLDSVLAQTYQNWECIVVDDGSIDATNELMAFYSAKDNRIQFHHRPKKRRKGANACRNYGFELSNGEYIQWFDSDDLMLPEFLKKKINAIEKNDVDFVLSKTANFLDPNSSKIFSRNDQYYRFEKFEINNYNYIRQYINWLTPDFFGKREVLEKVRFNEKLKSSQERNFFSKLTLQTVRVKVIDEFLTLRRIHLDSTQSKLKKNKLKKKQEYLCFLYETWLDLKSNAKPQVVAYLFNTAVQITLVTRVKWHFILGLTLGLLQKKRLKTAFWYFAYQASQKILKKEFFKERVCNKIQ